MPFWLPNGAQQHPTRAPTCYYTITEWILIFGFSSSAYFTEISLIDYFDFNLSCSWPIFYSTILLSLQTLKRINLVNIFLDFCPQCNKIKNQQWFIKLWYTDWTDVKYATLATYEMRKNCQLGESKWLIRSRNVARNLSPIKPLFPSGTAHLVRATLICFLSFFLTTISPLTAFDFHF